MPLIFLSADGFCVSGLCHYWPVNFYRASDKGVGRCFQNFAMHIVSDAVFTFGEHNDNILLIAPFQVIGTFFTDSIREHKACFANESRVVGFTQTRLKRDDLA
jgi:hypothetical protein